MTPMSVAMIAYAGLLVEAPPVNVAGVLVVVGTAEDEDQVELLGVVTVEVVKVTDGMVVGGGGTVEVVSAGAGADVGGAGGGAEVAGGGGGALGLVVGGGGGGAEVDGAGGAEDDAEAKSDIIIKWNTAVVSNNFICLGLSCAAVCDCAGRQ
jgi:hypothetical protein